MFKHSVPVPRLYRSAAKIAEEVNKNNDSVKNLVYQTKHPNTKALYALVVETLRQAKQLEFLLKRSKLLEREPRFNPWLARVLITELLWGKKRLAGESKPIKTILAYQQILNAHASDVEKQGTVQKAVRPRFVRINTVLISVQDAIDGFRGEGWTLVQYLDKNYEGFIKQISNLSEYEFMVDIHISELLIFPPNTKFYAHSAYKDGLIILQDKASCLPAHLLNPPPGSTILDMCAAPGMKTSHLAAKINNEGKVYAVDLDAKRLKTLENLMEKTGITCVEAINKDILRITNNDCQGVEYILVDPSCSGSGIVDRLELTATTVNDEQRIEKLRGFQIMILKHALRRFPNAKRVIYSTCSIYPEENEEIVQEALMQTAYFKLVNAHDLLKGPWVNFGSEKYGEIGSFCMYSKPDTDMSNGFFVAVFERLEEGEENKYFVQNTEFHSAKNDDKGILKNKMPTNNVADIVDVGEVKAKNKKKKNNRKLETVSNECIYKDSNETVVESNDVDCVYLKRNKKNKHKTKSDEEHNDEHGVSLINTNDILRKTNGKEKSNYPDHGDSEKYKAHKKNRKHKNKEFQENIEIEVKRKKKTEDDLNMSINKQNVTTQADQNINETPTKYKKCSDEEVSEIEYKKLKSSMEEKKRKKHKKSKHKSDEIHEMSNILSEKVLYKSENDDRSTHTENVENYDSDQTYTQVKSKKHLQDCQNKETNVAKHCNKSSRKNEKNNEEGIGEMKVKEVKSATEQKKRKRDKRTQHKSDGIHETTKTHSEEEYYTTDYHTTMETENMISDVSCKKYIKLESKKHLQDSGNEDTNFYNALVKKKKSNQIINDGRSEEDIIQSSHQKEKKKHRKKDINKITNIINSDVSEAVERQASDYSKKKKRKHNVDENCKYNKLA